MLELERPLTEHFWVNIADRRYPFVGLIEHSNFVGTENTGGRVFSHVTNYLPADHELLGLDAEELLDRYADGLRMLNPSFERSWVRRSWLFREPAGQPIVKVGYRELIPARQTPVAGLLLVNTTQIYPQDRGINFAIRDGERAAAEVGAASSPPALDRAGIWRATRSRSRHPGTRRRPRSEMPDADVTRYPRARGDSGWAAFAGVVDVHRSDPSTPSGGSGGILNDDVVVVGGQGRSSPTSPPGAGSTCSLGVAIALTGRRPAARQSAAARWLGVLLRRRQRDLADRAGSRRRRCGPSC